MNTRRNGRGFTLIELIFVVVLGAGLVGLLLPALGRARASARQLKCATQVRGIHQGMVIFAQNNQDEYPRPSKLDKANKTLALEDGTSPGIKDQTKNIVSCLIFSGFFGPELCLSPAESNPDIEADKDYEYSEPTAAVDKKLAIWDPRFKATPGPAFQGTRVDDKGNFSYAHAMPFGGRLKSWANTFASTESVLGNRGPWYELVGGSTGAWALSSAKPVDALEYSGAARAATVSNTLLIHGGRSTWEGNIAYNDNHIDFLTRPDPDSTLFAFAGLPKPTNERGDNVFVDENENSRTPGPDSLVGDGPSKNVNGYLRAYSGGRAYGTGKEAAMLDLKGAWFAD